MMVWEFVAWGYLTGVALVCLRQLAFSFLEMDEFAWRSINNVEFFGFFALSALFWPLVCLKRPEILLNPSCLFESELERAKQARIRSELEQRPPYCSGFITFTHRPVVGQADRSVTIFRFSSEDAESTLLEGGRFGPFEGRDQKALTRWLELAVTCDETTTEVPALWHHAFELVADELISKGIGECFCPECNSAYANKVLTPSTGSTGFGWLQNQYKCPEGHMVMSYDFIKVFCGTRHPCKG